MKYEIKNIMGTGDVGVKLNLNKLALELDSTEYEPEKFSGLIYRIKNPKATFIIFGSGKFVCTGIANEEDLKKAVEILDSKLNQIEKK